MKTGFSLLCLAGALTGCAHYTPLPLENGVDVPLSVPSSEGLTAAAAELKRPYLQPTTIDLSQPLDLNAIATIAVIANPDLKAQRVRAGVADAQAFAARLLPDPTFNIGANKVLSGPDVLLDLASALGFDIQSLRTRGARIAQAEAQARQVRLDLAWAEWQTAGQARLQAVRVVGLQRAQAITAASRDASRSLLTRTLRAAGRGDLSGDQIQAARVAAFTAEQQARTTERDLNVARFALTKLLGLPPASILRLAITADAGAPPGAERLFALARSARSDLAALRQGYSAQEAAVRLAIIQQFPTLDLTVNANRDSAGNVLTGPAVAFTLPLWNRNRGNIAIERTTREALKAEYEARLVQARADIAAAVGGIAVAERQRATALADLPALTRFAAASRRAANRGDLAAATAETAEQASRDRELVVTQTSQDLGEQMIALELLTGMPRAEWLK
ncbi:MULTISPECIES: TolC family protein [Sphingomonas]|jgi:cobalt-zinc-cadmium efflux system outer membrane protein|uniref:TolC family protein n=1 Tax=Sphingomonas sanguinis TaxID=33051 RepID=A0A7Y7QZD2_9SPHN|nr:MULTISPECIES: TolC family protein [Sphingomonas]MBZ6383529.1 TolC family protein [Sphingomonas sanguinis]MCI4653827.1 TolC family protein [Sphingomonas aquatilis]NNG51910.1 TolC family protein [Sphingomonas sanguinis]NVP32823.1 TolC family protein [Sphingomonas sanguinis]